MGRDTVLLYLNQLIRNEVICQLFENINFYMLENYIKISCSGNHFERANELINMKIDSLNKKQNLNLKINKIEIYYKDTLLSFTTLIETFKFLDKDLNIFYHIEGYDQSNFTTSVFATPVVINEKVSSYDLGDVCRFGWYSFYYHGDAIPSRIKNRFKANRFYKILIEPRSSLKHEQRIPKTNIKIETNFRYLNIDIISDSNYLLEAVEIWSFLVGDFLSVETQILLENQDLKIIGTGDDKLRIIKKIWKNISSEKNKFILSLYYDSADDFVSKSEFTFRIKNE